MKRTLAWAAAAVVLGSMSGCATYNAIQGAEQSLGQAAAAGAKTKAPYEYHSAEAYLSYAQHEHGEHDFSAARSFAAESLKFSSQALEKAKGGGK